MVVRADDLFEPDKPAELIHAGHVHMNGIIGQIKSKDKNAEVVVVAFCDPADKSQTPGSAMELTKKQAQAVVDYLKGWDAHKAGTFTPAQDDAARDGDRTRRRWWRRRTLAAGRSRGDAVHASVRVDGFWSAPLLHPMFPYPPK